MKAMKEIYLATTRVTNTDKDPYQENLTVKFQIMPHKMSNSLSNKQTLKLSLVSSLMLTWRSVNRIHDPIN